MGDSKSNEVSKSSLLQWLQKPKNTVESQSLVVINVDKGKCLF